MAPLFSARIAYSSPMVPETKMNGVSGETSRAMASAAMPSNPGMEKSDRMMSGANSFQRGGKRLLGVDDAVLQAQAGALELAHLELGVRGDVLGQQNADGRRGVHRRHFVGTRLVSSQYRPIFDTVSMKSSNCTGLTM